jgi:squalene-associated FAD-dependent desaturase
VTPPHVIVVGGGLAGLAAALACADRGARVTLLEARRRLGGATWSSPHRGLGFEIDNGQHVFLRCCDRYLAFLERLGVRDRVALQRLAVPLARPNGPIAWIRRLPLPAPAHLAESLLRFPTLSLGERLCAGITLRRFARLDPDDPALDERSLGSFLREQGESDPAREASLALAARVVRTGFLDSARGADLGWPVVPFSKLHAEPAAAALRARGARVQTGAAIDAIEASESGPPAVWSHGAKLLADAVVLAVPHEAAAGLLPAGADEWVDRAALAELGHSPIVNLHVVFDRRVMPYAVLAALDSELQWIFDRTQSAGLERGQYLTISLSAADRFVGEPADALRKLFVPALCALLPAARKARIERFAVTCERTATFRATPGTRRARPAPGTEIDGVFLAGAWTDTGWPATMEGAVRSGLAAADAALAACERPGAGRARRAA